MVLGAVLVRLVRRPVLLAVAFSVLASLVVLTFYVVHAIAG